MFTRSICPTRMNESKYLKAGPFAEAFRSDRMLEVLALSHYVACIDLKDLSNFSGKRFWTIGFLNESNRRIRPSMPGDRVVRVARRKNYLYPRTEAPNLVR